MAKQTCTLSAERRVGMTKCKGCVREKDNNESSCDMCFDFDLYESKNKKTNLYYLKKKIIEYLIEQQKQ